MRPAATYLEQMRRIERGERVEHAMAMRLDRLAAERGMRLEHVSEAERQLVRQKVAQLHQLREQRVAQEREGARERAAAGAAARPRPMNLAHSPIARAPGGDSCRGFSTRRDSTCRGRAWQRSPH